MRTGLVHGPAEPSLLPDPKWRLITRLLGTGPLGALGDYWAVLTCRVAASDGNRGRTAGFLGYGLPGKARMTEDKMRDLLVRHSGDETPTDIDEMVDAALALAELFEEAADDEVQLGLDELVLDAATASGALAATEAGEGDEQDDAVADAESAAADVNDESVASQVAFVLAKSGLEEGRAKLTGILGMPASPMS